MYAIKASEFDLIIMQVIARKHDANGPDLYYHGFKMFSVSL